MRRFILRRTRKIKLNFQPKYIVLKSQLSWQVVVRAGVDPYPDGLIILSDRYLVWKLIYLMSSFVWVFRIWFTATFLIKFTTWVIWIRLRRKHFIPLKYFASYNPENAREWNQRDWWSNSCWFAISAGNHETFRVEKTPSRTVSGLISVHGSPWTEKILVWGSRDPCETIEKLYDQWNMGKYSFGYMASYKRAIKSTIYHMYRSKYNLKWGILKPWYIS